MDKIQELAQMLKESSNVVFFGGAGMSTESGIPDFRSADGIYSQSLHREFTPEEMVSHSFMINHPAEFFDGSHQGRGYKHRVQRRAVERL